MGWTYVHKPNDVSVREFIEQEFRDLEFVESAVVGSVFYGACRFKKAPEQGVWALVVLTHRDKNSYYNFGYKDMDETMGPYYYDAPAKVLKPLTPTNDETALQWRAECWKRWRRRQAAAKVKVGARIRFENPVQFMDGHVAQTFIVDRWRNRFAFRSLENGRLYRITNWRRRAFELETA